jgi:methylene-fatty-acyl-phospholipid synthase
MLDNFSLSSFESVLDVNQVSLYVSLAAIAFNPTFWNIAARCGERNLHSTRSLTAENNLEYKKKTITKLFGGNSLYGCYALAITIFSLGIIRDSLCAIIIGICNQNLVKLLTV